MVGVAQQHTLRPIQALGGVLRKGDLEWYVTGVPRTRRSYVGTLTTEVLSEGQLVDAQYRSGGVLLAG